MKPQALLTFVLVAALGALTWALFFRGDSPAPVDAPAPIGSAETTPNDHVEPAGASTRSGAEPSAVVDAAAPVGNERTMAQLSEPDARARVSGRLVDPEGTPRAGVALTVSSWNLRGPMAVVADTPGADVRRLELETDRDGRFSFDLEGRRSGDLELSEDALVFAERARFEGTGEDQDLGDLLVVGAASVAGVVQDEAGRPVGGVRVVAEQGPLGFGATSVMESLDDGTFVLGKLRPGAWRLRASGGQFLPAVVDQQVTAGQAVTGVVMTLARGGVVTGRVVDDRGVGVPDVRVVARRKELSGEMEIVRFSDDEAVTTDGNGDFRIGGLDGERATLRARGDGYTTALQTVDAGASGVELRVVRMGSVAGVLLTTSGEPIAGSRVRAQPEAARGGSSALVEEFAGVEFQGYGRAAATTDEQGRFVIENVEPGDVRVEATGAGHLPARQRGLRVLPAQRLDGVRLVADAGAVVRVEVVDGAGEPIRGAEVRVARAPRQQQPGVRFETRVEGDGPGAFLLAGRDQLGTAETDEQGIATVAGLPAVDAVVEASHPEFAPTDKLRVALPASGALSQRLVMEAPGFVDVTVTLADGAVAAGTSVMLQRAGAKGDEAVDRGDADADGRVRFGPLRAGGYTAVLARAPQARRAGGMMMFVGGERQRIASSAEQVQVVAGETSRVDLVMPVLTTLSGRVLGDGGGVSGVVVELESIDDGDEAMGFGGRQETTGADGSYSFDGVEAGSYEVRYGKPGQVVKARLDLEVPPNTPALQRDLVLRTGSVRVAVVSKEDAEPVAKAELRLVRQGSPGAPKRRPQRVMMVSVVSDDSGGESSSTMTFGNQRVVTDEDGVATFEDVPVGDYTLEVESGKHAPWSKADVQVVERQLTDCGTAELDPAGQLRGVVEDQDGERAMALVQCRPEGEAEWTRTEVAMQGSFRVRGLAPGRYEVRARPLGMQAGEPSEPVVVEVVAGKTAVQDLSVKK